MGRIALGFLIGVCWIHTLAALPGLIWVIALAGAVLLAIVMRAAAVCALLLGIGWAWGAAALRLANDLPAQLEGADLQVSGYIASLPDPSQTDPHFTVDVIDGPAGAPRRIGVTWYKAGATPWPGELWRFTVRLKRRNGFANPGGFDYEGRLFREGIGASGYVRDAPAPERLRGAGWRYPVLQARAWIAQRLEQALGEHPMLGVVQGLAIGDTHAMSAAQWRVFAATGTTHLMAISGLHIGAVAALAAWAGGAVVRWRGAQSRGWNALHGRVIAGSAAALAYAALAGLSIPTQRTLIMLCVYFASLWRRRQLCVSRTLGLALLGVLIVDPFAPLTAGAWLSFGAVAIILLATSGRLGREGAVRSFSRIQLALSIGLTPVLLNAFGGVSLVSPIANAVAVPLFTLAVVPGVLAGAAASALSPALGGVVLAIPSWLLTLSWPLFEWLAALPLALWWFPQTPASVLISTVAGSALLILPGLWPTRLAGVLLCAPLVMHRPATPDAGNFEITVLDVGQGLASVVRTRSHVLVYDAGPAFQSGRDAGEMVVTPYLRHSGARSIDVLMISHGDLDHRGGAQSILQAIPVELVLHGPSVQMSAPGVLCERGRSWVWDEVEFEILHPASGTAFDGNNSSCVLRIAGRGGAVVLTGDVERAAEAELVAGGLEPADVVVAPHHGSRTSSTAGFIAALRPQVVVYPVGYRNRWGFPSAEVAERWQDAGARAYTTADSGAVHIRIEENSQPRVSEYRRTHARYWRR